MPALPPVPQTLRVAISGNLGDSSWAQIMHWAYAGSAISSADATTLAHDIWTSYQATFLPNLNQVLTLESVKVEDLTSSTAHVGEYVAHTEGAISSAPAPANAALVISHKIARRYRGGHPRQYFAGLSAVDMFNVQQWTSTVLTNFTTDWTTFRGDIAAVTLATGSPFTFVSVSYRSGNAPRVAPVVDVVASSTVQDRICSQRRRLGILLAE